MADNKESSSVIVGIALRLYHALSGTANQSIVWRAGRWLSTIWPARKAGTLALAHQYAIESILVSLLPALAILTYVDNVNRYLIGVLALVVLAGLALDGIWTYGNALISPRRVVVLLGTIIYIVVGAWPLLGDGIGTLLAPARYAAVLGFLTIGGVDVIRDRFQRFVDTTVACTMILVALAIPTLVVGTYHIGPFVVADYYPLRVAGVRLATSSSLFALSSYWGMFLALVVGLVGTYGVSFAERRDHQYTLMGVFALFAVFARSRSALLALVVVFIILTVQRIATSPDPSDYMRTGRIVLPVFGIGGVALLAVGPIRDAITSMILDRGLNNRGVLFNYGIQAWQQNPEGAGFGRISNVLPDNAPNTTVQNSYLGYLVMGGLPLFLIGSLAYLGGTAIAATQAILTRKKFAFGALVVCTTMLWDALWRTYVFGGIGFIPLTWTIAVLAMFIGPTD